MSVLSITFHTTETISKEWDHYLENNLHQMVENLIDAEKYILSEVETEMISEGKNTNLLLIFENEEKRQDFVEIELINITDRILKEFGQNVMIFKTYLNPKKSRF
ncbi:MULTISPECIES: DUF4286 family protein [Chryseobacterium]|uniref:DUF4286 domain-containing protein n=1 Tax=Chryseobacterium salivictor TaxID=2547600 RepID=A0A4V1ALG6_9FLAO|nr:MULTISPECIES: DUF4286 family protein [Chryseobacterium]MDQ0476461.1 hypothetical protein [Chryseobacterium sp. MDT2-18]QBO59694.1 hypothetical protein NBC122_02894 [Chryseobacterium salivictor]